MSIYTGELIPLTNRPTDVNDFAAYVHELNIKWWPENKDERSQLEMRMLMISEVSEGMEGARKDLMDDKLPHRKMLEVELADYMIRLLDYCCGRRIEIMSKPEQYPDLLEGIPATIAEQLFTLVEQTTVRCGNESRDVYYMFGTVEMIAIHNNLDLWGAVHEKLEYNKTREDHKLENRMAAGGKKW